MKIVRLEHGRAASESCDCIQIQERPDGRFDMSGNALDQCEGDDEGTSVSITRGEPYDSCEAAEAAGIAWAASHCVAQLFVTRSDGKRELPDSLDDA